MISSPQAMLYTFHPTRKNSMYIHVLGIQHGYISLEQVRRTCTYSMYLKVHMHVGALSSTLTEGHSGLHTAMYPHSCGGYGSLCSSVAMLPVSFLVRQ